MTQLARGRPSQHGNRGRRRKTGPPVRGCAWAARAEPPGNAALDGHSCLRASRSPLFLLAAAALATPATAQGQHWKTISSWRAVTDEEGLRVRVAYTAGVLTIRPGPAQGLYEARLRFDEDAERPQMDYEHGRLRVGAARRDGVSVRRRHGGELDLKLPTRVPVTLDVQFGAGQAEVDLTGVPVERLELSTGAAEAAVRIGRPNPAVMELANFQVGAADFSVSGLGNMNAKRISAKAGVGSVTLDLRGPWETEAHLLVEMGVGLLALRVPESLAVRVRRDAPRLLASSDLDRMEKRGDAYYSWNWNDAGRKVDIEIRAGVGGIELEWIR